MSTTVIRFRCEVCGERIERDKGYVGASFAQVRADLPVEWFAAHYTCRPDDDAYWIDAHRIEQNADIVMLLHRDKDAAPDKIGIAVAKNRDGSEGSCLMKFDGARSRIAEPTWQERQAWGSR